MKPDMTILKQCALFQGMNDTDITGMLSCLGAVIRSYSKGQLILSEGDPATHIGIVLSGSVQIMREDYYGNRSLVGIARPSQLFGEAFSCAGITSLPVNILSLKDSTIMLLDCNHILTFCSNACEFHNRLVRNLLHIVAEKSLTLHQKLDITSKRSTKEKLMAFLLLQAKEHGSAEFTIPFDRQQLADYLGVERSAMSAELGKLIKEGYIESKKNRFKLLKAL